MGIHAALFHETAYRYDRLVSMGPQIIRLRPAPHARTGILSYSLKVSPDPHFLNWQQDPHGNYLARVVFPEDVEEFRVEVDLVADMAVQNPFDFFLEPDAETFPFAYDEHLRKDLESYLKPLPAGERLKAWLDATPRDEQRTIDFLVGLNARLEQDINYLIRMEPGVQTPEETLTLAKGSCRDSGWLLVQILRHFGLAARFVSGYLIQLAADVKSLDGPSGPEADFTDLHAWAEVYLPGAGWVGLDPTSGLFADEGHIPLAATPEPRSAAPITGLVGPSEVDFDVKMTIQRVLETPRVTKPYSEEQWAAIEAFGDVVDQELAEHDVRLTMGGEPTFVSIDHPDGDEWNTAAVGPTKRALAEDSDPPPEGSLRARRVPPLRPGQMVPGRAAAALDLRALLAPGRAAGLAKPVSDRDGDRGCRADHRGRRAAWPGGGDQARGRPGSCAARLRGSLAFHPAGAAASGKSRSVRFEA